MVEIWLCVVGVQSEDTCNMVKFVPPSMFLIVVLSIYLFSYVSAISLLLSVHLHIGSIRTDITLFLVPSVRRLALKNVCAVGKRRVGAYWSSSTRLPGSQLPARYTLHVTYSCY